MFVCMCISRIRKPVYSYSTNPDRRFSSSTSQHFKMSPPFASSEGVSASGDRLQSDGVQDTHLLPHSLSTRIRERMCDFALTHSHSPFAYFAYIPSYSLLIILCSDRILTCRIKSIHSPAKVGLVVTDLITSPVVSWEGWETPPPPPAPRLSCHFFAQPRAWEDLSAPVVTC